MQDGTSLHWALNSGEGGSPCGREFKNIPVLLLKEERGGAGAERCASGARRAPRKRQEELMKIVFAVLALASAASGAFAQDFQPSPLPTGLDLRSGPQEPTPGEWEGSLDLFFRYSMIRGNDGAGGKWSDDFSDGLGFRVEGALEYHLDKEWSVGGFLSTGLDHFRGKSSGGISLDDWTVVPVVVGPMAKVYFTPRLFAEARVGVGVVSYGAVDAKGLGQSVPLFDRSTAVAWEVGGHLGYKFNVDHGRAPTPQLALLFGFSFEQWGAPKVDQATLPGASAKPVQNVALDLGFWFGF
jgi:hypothetical protein